MRIRINDSEFKTLSVKHKAIVALAVPLAILLALAAVALVVTIVIGAIGLVLGIVLGIVPVIITIAAIAFVWQWLRRNIFGR